MHPRPQPSRGSAAVSSGEPRLRLLGPALEPGQGQASDWPPGPWVGLPTATAIRPRTRKLDPSQSRPCARPSPAGWIPEAHCLKTTERNHWPPRIGCVWTELAILLDSPVLLSSDLSASGRSCARKPSPTTTVAGVSPESCSLVLQPVPPTESAPSDPILHTPRKFCLFLFWCLQYSPKFPLLLCPLHPLPLGAP